MDKIDNQIIIDVLNANQRLNKFLMKYLNKADKSFIYKMLRKKRIKLNGGKADGSELLCEGDVITFYISPETLKELYAPNNAVSMYFGKSLPTPIIIYENEDILIANKPSGLLTHAEKKGDDTLIDRVSYYLHKKGEYDPFKQGSFAPVCANRLDRNTSGIVACAKNLPAAQLLAETFRTRNAFKYYIAVVYGKIGVKVVVHNYLYKDFETNKVEVQNHIGKEALTEIEPMKAGDDFTVVKIHLHTGRTHQIRAHLQSIGHPIIGDPKYGNKKINDIYKKTHNIRNQMLHAYELTVMGQTFNAAPPNEFNLF